MIYAVMKSGLADGYINTAAATAMNKRSHFSDLIQKKLITQSL